MYRFLPAALVAALAVASAPRLAAAEPVKPNVVVILADDTDELAGQANCHTVKGWEIAG